MVHLVRQLSEDEETEAEYDTPDPRDYEGPGDGRDSTGIREHQLILENLRAALGLVSPATDLVNILHLLVR